jgi:hypothetical protein
MEMKENKEEKDRLDEKSNQNRGEKVSGKHRGMQGTRGRYSRSKKW